MIRPPKSIPKHSLHARLERRQVRAVIRDQDEGGLPVSTTSHRNQNRALGVSEGPGQSMTWAALEPGFAGGRPDVGVVAVRARCQQCWVCARRRGFNACAGTSTDTCSATWAPYESVILKFTRPNHRPSVERAQRFSRPGTRPVATRRPPGGGSSASAVPSSGGPQNASRSIQTGRSSGGSGCACDADHGLYMAPPSRWCDWAGKRPSEKVRQGECTRRRPHAVTRQ